MGRSREVIAFKLELGMNLLSEIGTYRWVLAPD